jgi:sugar lactone lactonase YvrE
MRRNTQPSALDSAYSLLLILLLALAALPARPARAATIVYVKPGGIGNGSSWASAADLQPALTAAASGTELWVAKGTYMPAITSQATSFTLKNGVAIYGGFSGTETQRSQRSLDANQTILSGDLLSNDTGVITTTNTTRADNSYHVVRGGGAGPTAVLDGVTIRGGNANVINFFDGRGGGILNDTSGPTLANLVISGNSARYEGGGIFNYVSSPTITNVTISANIAGGAGGGISGDTMTLINVTISGNTTLSNGGGMSIYGGATLVNVVISGNTAASDGGGIYNESSSPTLTNVTISGNTAQSFGGGIENFNASPTLTNVTISSNFASQGGGMDNNGSYGSNSTLTNVIFSNNSAQDGGGMANNYGRPTLTNVTFSGNSASNDGGGMVNAVEATLTNVTFSGNTAEGVGAGLYNIAASPKLTNVIFSDNTSQNVGAGMYNYSGDPTLTYTRFSGNVADGSGGGMYVNGGSPTLTNVTFSGNSAKTSPGGGLSNAGNATLTNVTFSGNTSQGGGGGMHQVLNTATLTNVTFSGNTSQGGGGGLFRESGVVHLANTLLAGNTGTTGPDCSGTLTSQGYNLVGNNSGCTLTAAAGDQVGTAGSPLDPKIGPLQDNGGFTPTRALLPGSPALNKGSLLTPGSGAGACGAADQRGVQRPQGGRCDIGAYEALPAPDTTSTSVGATGQPGSTNGYTATARFDAPSSIAATVDGALALIADTGNHTIRKLDVKTRLVTTLAGKPDVPGSTNGITNSARFREPYGIALTADGRRALVADTGNNTIRQIDVLSGMVTTLAGTAIITGSTDAYTTSARFNQPVGIALDAGGTLALVADYGNHTIRKIDVVTGKVTTLAGNAGAPGNQNGSGKAARFNHPTGVALSPDGTFALVGDTGNRAIRKIDVATGRVTTLASLNPANIIGPALLSDNPLPITIDPQGCTAAVADSQTHTIKRIEVFSGLISPIAGSAGNPGSANGSGTNARFNTPKGVALTNGKSTALVADTRNNTIRRIDGIETPKCQRVFLPLARR